MHTLKQYVGFLLNKNQIKIYFYIQSLDMALDKPMQLQKGIGKQFLSQIGQKKIYYLMFILRQK